MNYFNWLAEAFVRPFDLSLILLGVGFVCSFFLSKKLGFGLMMCGLFVLIGFSLPITAHLLVQGLEKKYPPVPLEHVTAVEYIVVLGGATSLSPNSMRIETELTDASDRLRYAAKLYQAGKASKIIFAAGTPASVYQGSDEAVGGERLLLEWGVEREALSVDRLSENTWENAIETRKLIGQYRNPLLLVTSAYHMVRAVTVFEKLGFDIIAMPTDFQSTGDFKFNRYSWRPNLGSLGASTLALHEYVGLIIYRLRGWAE